MNKAVKQLTYDESRVLGLEFLSIDHVFAQSKVNLRMPHRAAFYLIIWFKTGTPTHVVDFHPVAIKPDSFLFVRKDAMQFFDQESEYTSSTLLFTDAFFCENENDHLFLRSCRVFDDMTSDNLPAVVPVNDQLAQLWQWMQAEEQNQSIPFRSALLKHYLSSFMLLAERELLKNSRLPQKQDIHLEYLLAFKQLLEQNFDVEKSVSFYTGKMFVSAKVLNQATQASLGKSPKQLIDERVTLEAKRLLVHSTDTVKTIGLTLGFDEPTNFNKFFKKHAGKTAAEFRNVYL